MTPIEMLYQTGATIYAVLHNPDGTVWNDVSKVWEAFNAGHWAQYGVALTEQGASGYYSADFPAEIGDDVLTTEVIYLQGGGSPATNDAGLTMGQSQGANIAAIAGVASAPANLAASVGGMKRGSVIAGTLTASAFSTNLASTTNAAYQGRVLLFTSGVLKDQVANIIGYNGTTHVITVGGPFTAAPSAADEFIII